MKNILKIKLIAAFALLAMIATSCTDYEQNYPDPNKPVVTVASQDISITEGETGSITLNISRSIGNPIDLKLMPLTEQSTATDSDYSVTAAGEFTSGDDGVGPVPAYDIVVPAGSTTFDIPIDAIDDLDIEGAETVVFELTSTGSGMGVVDEDNNIITVTINNNESKDFYTELAWSGTYTGTDGAQHEFCDLDLDLEIYTADFGAIVANSYSDCPESIRLSPGEIEDGTYYIVPSFWTNAGSTAPAENVQIPARITFTQPGVQTETIPLDDVWDYETGGYDDGNEDGAYYVNYVLEVNGEHFTVTDGEGNVVFEQ